MKDDEDKIDTMLGPAAACDAFRDLPSVCTVDPRCRSRAVLDPKSGSRPMTIEDHWRDIGALALHEGVPISIRVHFDTARNLLLHSWFVFRFQQVAEMHAYASVEFALRWRAGLPLKASNRDLKVLLGRAFREGWIRDVGFRRFQEVADRRAEYEEMEARVTGREPDLSCGDTEWYVRMLSNLLPKFRNKLAHGSALMAPTGKQTLALCCDIINQLFPTGEANS